MGASHLRFERFASWTFGAHLLRVNGHVRVIIRLLPWGHTASHFGEDTLSLCVLEFDGQLTFSFLLDFILGS